MPARKYLFVEDTKGTDKVEPWQTLESFYQVNCQFMLFVSEDVGVFFEKKTSASFQTLKVFTTSRPNVVCNLPCAEAN